MKALRYLWLLAILAAGCSVFPGLRVLSGETPDQINAGSQVVFFDRDEDYSALEADHKIRHLAAFREAEAEPLRVPA